MQTQTEKKEKRREHSSDQSELKAPESHAGTSKSQKLELQHKESPTYSIQE